MGALDPGRKLWNSMEPKDQGGPLWEGPPTRTWQTHWPWSWLQTQKWSFALWTCYILVWSYSCHQHHLPRNTRGVLPLRVVIGLPLSLGCGPWSGLWPGSGPSQLQSKSHGRHAHRCHWRKAHPPWSDCRVQRGGPVTWLWPLLATVSLACPVTW